LKQGLFEPQALDVLREVQLMAEDLVGEHFRLSSFGPVRRCY